MIKLFVSWPFVKKSEKSFTKFIWSKFVYWTFWKDFHQQPAHLFFKKTWKSRILNITQFGIQRSGKLTAINIFIFLHVLNSICLSKNHCYYNTLLDTVFVHSITFHTQVNFYWRSEKYILISKNLLLTLKSFLYAGVILGQSCIQLSSAT